jgi:adenosylcobinamide-phosphate synthase
MLEPLGNGTLVLLLALAIEVLIGDPRTRWHPVARFGQAMNLALRAAPRSGATVQLAFGAAVVVAGVGGVALIAAGGLAAATALHPLLGVALSAALLKTSFSYRQLEQEAALVASHVAEDRIAAARSALHALVSRDTQTLSPPQAASAAIESVAENLSDSFVAPLLYFALFGVPGALAYRAVNTLDAMIGYHGRYEYLGRTAAKLDDLANLIPARLTALLIVVAAALAGAAPGGAARITRRDHTRTESPNAGWPMAAMAGALGVQLEKLGHYRLGDAGRACGAETIRTTIGIARWTVALAAGLALTGLALIGTSR